MKRMQKLIVVAAALALAIPVGASTVFPLTVQKGADGEFKGVAIAVADGLLLTSSVLVENNQQCLVGDPGSSAQVVATVSASDAESDLALLSAPGLEVEAITLALEPPVEGRHAALVAPDGTQRDGVVHSVVEIPGGQVTYRFSRVYGGDGESAAPILNNCGELLAISLMEQREENLWMTGSLEAAKAFLTAQGVSYKTAASACSSLVDRLAAAEKRRQELQDQRKTLESEKKDLTQERNDLAEQKHDLEQELEKLKDREKEAASQTEAERKRIEADKKRVQQQLEEVEQRSGELEEQLQNRDDELNEISQRVGDLETTIKQLQDELARARRNMWITGIILGAFVCFGIGFGMVQRRARRRERLEAEAALAQARSELEQSSTATFSDVILTGMDAEGREVRVKINGDALARAEDGQVIGRSSADADYVIATDSISRRHARLRVVDGEMLIEDLRSLNGTYLDGVPLRPGLTHRVRQGAKITFGDVECEAAFLGTAAQ